MAEMPGAAGLLPAKVGLTNILYQVLQTCVANMHVLHGAAIRPHLVLPRLGLRQNGHPDAAVWVLGHLQMQSWAAGACCFDHD